MNHSFHELNFKKSAWLYLIIACLLLSNLNSCSSEIEKDHARKDSRNIKNNTTAFIYNAIPQNSSARISPQYSKAINTFSVNLLLNIYRDSLLNKNVVISPLSISRNLAILTEGATGKSKEELLSALGGEATLDDAKDALAELLYADNSVILQCADALWFNSTKCSANPLFEENSQKEIWRALFGYRFQ